MTINNATVEQINVALLDIDKRIKALNTDSEIIKSLQNSVKTIKSSLNETQAGLTSGATYDINISGNAATATQATTATNAVSANTAASASEAGHAESADTISAGGTSGQVLTSNGSSLAPSWQDPKLKTATLYSGSYNTANGSITLSDNIENYSALIVMVAMYGGSSPDQLVSIFVPKAAYYWRGSDGYRNEFIALGTIEGNTRRMYFGFLASAPTVLYTGAIAGATDHLPVLKYVIGIK